MRPAVSLAVLLMLTGVACGPKSSPEKPMVAMTFPAVACSTLTEADVTQLLKALPAFKSALEAREWKPAAQEYGGNPVDALTALVEGMNVPGVSESLEAIGSDWGTFRATRYKGLVASAALNVEAVGLDQTAQMKRDTTEAGRKMFADFQSLKGACAAVPPANLELVKTHQQDLQALGGLGR
jgi:hypothetical protein